MPHTGDAGAGRYGEEDGRVSGTGDVSGVGGVFVSQVGAIVSELPSAIAGRRGGQAGPAVHRAHAARGLFWADSSARTVRPAHFRSSQRADGPDAGRPEPGQGGDSRAGGEPGAADAGGGFGAGVDGSAPGQGGGSGGPGGERGGAQVSERIPKPAAVAAPDGARRGGRRSIRERGVESGDGGDPESGGAGRHRGGAPSCANHPAGPDADLRGRDGRSGRGGDGFTAASGAVVERQPASAAGLRRERRGPSFPVARWGDGRRRLPGGWRRGGVPDPGGPGRRGAVDGRSGGAFSEHQAGAHAPVRCRALTGGGGFPEGIRGGTPGAGGGGRAERNHRLGGGRTEFGRWQC